MRPIASSSAVVGRESGCGAAGAIEEQAHAGDAGEPRAAVGLGGDRQRRQRQHLLAVQRQRLAAGGDDRQPRAARQQRRGDHACGLQDVLAVVEHHQRRVPRERIADQIQQRRLAGLAQADRGGEDADQLRLVARRDEPDVHRAAAETALEQGGGLACQPRLATAAGTDQRHQPALAQRLLDEAELLVAADEGGGAVDRCGARSLAQRAAQLGDEIPHRALPPRRVGGQPAGEDAAHRTRRRRGQAGQLGGGRADAESAPEQDDGGRREAVHVAGGHRRLRRLGRLEAARAGNPLARDALARGAAEVDHDDAPRRRQHEVGRLDVAVDDRRDVAVQVRERSGGVGEPAQHLALVHACAARRS